MATTYSDQRTNDRATPQVTNEGNWVKRRVPWTYTVAGAAIANNDVVEICRLPAGCRVILPESYIKISATTGASSTMDVGYSAYKKHDGTTAVEDVDGIINGLDSTQTGLVLLSGETLGAAADDALSYGIVDFSDAIEDVVVKITALDSGGTFDGDIGDTWEGWFTVEVH